MLTVLLIFALPLYSLPFVVFAFREVRAWVTAYVVVCSAYGILLLDHLRAGPGDGFGAVFADVFVIVMIVGLIASLISKLAAVHVWSRFGWRWGAVVAIVGWTLPIACTLSPFL